MHPVMTRLAKDHARLASLLQLLEQRLDQFHAGAEPDYDLMNELLDYIASYADTVHHPTEELVFARLCDQITPCPDLFEVLRQQHVALGQLNKRFRQTLDGILHEAVVLRDEVETQGRELIATLRGHMHLEDTEAFPFALAHLADADWEAIAEQAPTAEDPLFGTPDPVRFRLLYQYLMRQAPAAPDDAASSTSPDDPTAHDLRQHP